MQKVSHRPLSIPKILLAVMYQLGRNEHARYHRYRAQKLKAPPKLPPSKRPVLHQENSS